jgi:hypothetical protein
MLIFNDSFLLIASRSLYLAHRALGIPVGSWVAAEPSETRLAFTTNPPGLEAVLPLLRWAIGTSNNKKHINPAPRPQLRNSLKVRLLNKLGNHTLFTK